MGPRAVDHVTYQTSLKLYAGKPEGRVFLLIDGAGEGNFFDVAEELRKSADTIAVVSLAGFHSDPEDLRKLSNAEQWVREVLDVISELEIGDRELILGGHSLGTLVALVVASRIKDKYRLTSLVLICPPLNLQSWALRFHKVLIRTLGCRRVVQWPLLHKYFVWAVVSIKYFRGRLDCSEWYHSLDGKKEGGFWSKRTISRTWVWIMASRGYFLSMSSEEAQRESRKRQRQWFRFTSAAISVAAPFSDARVVTSPRDKTQTQPIRGLYPYWPTWTLALMAELIALARVAMREVRGMVYIVEATEDPLCGPVEQADLARLVNATVNVKRIKSTHFVSSRKRVVARFLQEAARLGTS